MAYDKYKKVRSKNKKASPSQGLKNLDNYISDEEKTAKPEKNTEENEISRLSSLRDISNYVENEMKIINPENMQHLVSVLNCNSPETFVDECEKYEKLYHAHKTERLNKGASAVHAYHIINSFKGTDIDPEIVHQAGIDLARALCGNDFAVKIATHLNTNNYHNHIVINAYSNDASRKFKDEYHLYEKIRRLSNAISLQYGLEIIYSMGEDRKTVSELLEKWEPRSGIKSVYREMKEDIRKYQNLAVSFDDFKMKMHMAGYEIRDEKGTLYFSKDGYQASSKSLGMRYYKESISAQIRNINDLRDRKELRQRLYRENQQIGQHINIRPIKISKYDDNGNRIPWLLRLLKLALSYLEKLRDTFFDPDAARQYPNNPSLSSADKKILLVQSAITLLEDYHINSQKGLDDFTNHVGYRLRTAEYNIAQLSSTLDRMKDVLEQIEKESFFAHILADEHIEAQNLDIPDITQTEVKKNLASLDPLSPRQRKQLWNALHNSSFVLKDGMNSISRMDAERLLAFLKSPSVEIPNELVQKEVYQAERASDFLKIRASEWVKNLESQYGKEDATDAQKRALQKRLSPEQLEVLMKRKLTKSIAVRILASTETRPEISECAASNFTPPTKWMLQTLEDIRVVFPDDFNDKHIDFSKMAKEDANNLITYYLSKFDDPSKTYEKRDHDSKNKLKIDDLPEEIKPIADAYVEIQKLKKSFGIKNSDQLSQFKQLFQSLSSKVEQLENDSRGLNLLYQNLKRTQSVVKRCDSKMFLCGVRFTGSDESIKSSISNLGQDNIDEFKDILRDFDFILQKSISEGSEESSLKDGLFIPPDPEVILYLTKLKAVAPELFIDHNGNPISVRLLSSYDAANFLTKVRDSGYLDAKQQKLIAKEREFEQKQSQDYHKTDRVDDIKRKI